MSDLTPAERLAKLCALEEWLAWQLETTRRKIRDLEQQQIGYVLEREIKQGHPLGATIHRADCTMPSRETRPVDASLARDGLTKDSRFFTACDFCDPRPSLGIDG
jgi:nitrile hydratase